MCPPNGVQPTSLEKFEKLWTYVHTYILAYLYVRDSKQVQFIASNCKKITTKY